jgi:hypothetical protein
MELRRGGTVCGSIRRAARRGVLCDLPAELSPAVQTFIGFVVIALWNRAAASSGAVVVAAGG